MTRTTPSDRWALRFCMLRTATEERLGEAACRRIRETAEDPEADAR